MTPFQWGWLMAGVALKVPHAFVAAYRSLVNDDVTEEAIRGWHQRIEYALKQYEEAAK